MNVQCDWLINNLDRIKNKLFIVEGKKDKKALNSLGINNIITLKKSLFETVEEISKKTNECVILTDLDKEGRKLYGKLRNDLQKHGVKIDNSFRNFLFRETKVRQIEALDKLVRKA